MKHTYTNHIDCIDALARYLVRNVPDKWRRIEAFVEVDHEVEMVTSELVLPGKSWSGNGLVPERVVVATHDAWNRWRGNIEWI